MNTDFNPKIQTKNVLLDIVGFICAACTQMTEPSLTLKALSR